MTTSLPGMRPPDPDETVVGLAGDWHGNRAKARDAVKTMASLGVRSLFHLGDLGVWPGGSGRQFISEAQGALRRAGMTLYLTPGNHEDYDQLAEVPVDEPSGMPWLTDNIAILPRGHRWTMGGRSFVSLGGAPSLDYQWRTEGEDWWPAEAVTADDVRRVVDGGRTDVMLTHDAPLPGTPAVEQVIAGNPMGWTDPALAYAAIGRDRMTEAFTAVQPALLAHGHFHVRDAAVVTVPGSDRVCQVLSVNTAGQAGNLVVLDLSTDPVSWEWVT